MSDWSGRIRGAIAMGLTFGAAWVAAGIVVARVPGLDSDLPFAFLFAPFGFVSGLIFFAILSAVESRRGLDRMSIPLFAGLGAVSGLVPALVIAALRGKALEREVLLFGAVLALVGAACAAGSLGLARRSPEGVLGRRH